VAEVENTVVGTIAVLIMHNIGHLGKKSAIFETVAVSPEWQGQGIGKKMLKSAVEYPSSISGRTIPLLSLDL
jgi:N-acetylglutamate synthase-like GNAT family acetyltransferase